MINDWIIEQVVVWVARTRAWGMDSWLDGWVDRSPTPGLRLPQHGARLSRPLGLSFPDAKPGSVGLSGPPWAPLRASLFSGTQSRLCPQNHPPLPPGGPSSHSARASAGPRVPSFCSLHPSHASKDDHAKSGPAAPVGSLLHARPLLCPSLTQRG